MSINYYDSVRLSILGRKEQPFSLTNTLYSWGAKLSKLSSMYGGKAYTIILSKDGIDKIEKSKGSYPSTYSYMQKISAVAGYCLKRIAGYFNEEIRIKHVLVRQWEQGWEQNQDQEQGKGSFGLKEFKVSILSGYHQLAPKKTSKGEGADVGPEYMLGCCAQFCNECCQMCAGNR